MLQRRFRRGFIHHIALLLFTVCYYSSTTVFAQAPTATGAPVEREIIICVDGVGFSTIEKMRAEGRFSSFRAPARMIAPFPTLTNLSMSEILRPAGAGPAAGYEDSFFDTAENRMRGGLVARFRGDRFVRGTFRELFDYHPSALKSGLGYAAPPLSTYLEALSDLVRLKQKARGAKTPVFFAYTGATDSLAHLGGERLVRSFLARLDETVEEIARESPVPVRVTIFSDHGNHYRDYRRVRLKSALRRAGFRLDGRLRDRRSVVFPQFGLVGCAVLFTSEENEGSVARAAAGVEGVDFASYEQGGVVHVVAGGGAATLERRGGRFRYTTQGGDPLGLREVARALAGEGKADAEGFIHDDDWLAATREAERPDAVRRVYEGTNGLVRNRANVIVNLREGFYTGSTVLDVFAFLQATHGNLGREQSFGFIMATDREFPAYVRAETLWDTLGSPELRKRGARAHHR